MYDKGIFVFGSKIISTESQRDSVSRLPLELSWVIFAYLDDIALRNASHAYTRWKHIILANRKLRNRLNTFELSLILGSRNLVRYHRKPKKKRMTAGKYNNYLATGVCTEASMKTTVIKSKRGGDDIILHTKRFKLY